MSTANVPDILDATMPHNTISSRVSKIWLLRGRQRLDESHRLRDIDEIDRSDRWPVSP